MMYKLVRYVEDLIWHVCHNSNVRISNENHLVHAKYQGYFYPALIINEGTKEQMNALKNRYEHHDSILKKYFKFTPVDHIGLKNASTQTFDMRKEFTESTTQTDDISEESKRKCLDNIDVGNAEVVDMQVTEAKIHHAAISAPNQTACAGCKGDDRNSDVGNMSFLSQTIVNEELNIHKDYELSDFSPEQSDEEYKLSVDSCSSTSTDIDDISEIDVSFSEGDKNYDRSEIGSVDGTLLSHCDNVVREAQNNDITDEISSNISLGNNFVDSSKSLASPNVVSYAKNQHFCIYCKTKVDKFARHLETKHKFESRVKEYLKFPKGDAKRRAIIANIRSLGTFMYNTDSEFNKGDILVARRTKCSERRRVEDYVPCPKCKNFFRKTLLYRHYRRCGCTVSRTYIKSAPRNLQNLSRATLYEGTIQFSKLQKYILPGMIHDDITRIIHRDKLILIYGNYLSQKYDGETHLVNMIRQKLRQVGQLLQTIRRLESTVTDLISVIRPSLFNKFVEAVRICAGYNEADGSFRAPSLISAIGQTVKECAEKLVIEYIKDDNLQGRQEVEAWLCVYSSEFSVLCKRANTILFRRKWNKPRFLPLTSDILKLNKYLKDKWQQALSVLNSGFDLSFWTQLSKCTLLLILIFNRKRVGEMEKLLINDYKNRHNIQEDSETYKNLKPSEKLFAQRYVRVEVRGKLGRPVSLMISHQEVAAIDLLLHFRSEANVHHTNPYVFGRGKDKYFEGARCLRDASNYCGADRPELLRGTKLRKHIATISQAMNLTDNELSILADYMGHNIDIHRQFYRLPNEAIHLAKISQLLFALDSNTIDKFKGKCLDDIDVSNVELDDMQEMTETEIHNIAEISATDQTACSEYEGDSGSHDAEDISFSYQATENEVENARNINIEKNINYNVEKVFPLNQAGNNSAEKNYRYHMERISTVNQAGCSKNEGNTRYETGHRIKKTEEVTCMKNSGLEASKSRLDWTPERRRRRVSRNCMERRTWRTPEKFALRQYFKKHLENKILPSKQECASAIDKFAALRKRTDVQVKLWVSNELKRTCKKNLFQ